MTRVTRVLMAVLFAVPMAGLSAQATLRSLEGKNVRLGVSLVDGEDGTVTIRGTVIEVGGDSIHLLQDGGQALRIPVNGVRSLQVKRGRDRSRGAGFGALAGAGFGLFITALEPAECDGYGTGIDCRSDGSKPTDAQYVAEYVLTFGAIGAMIGAIVGTDRWEQVITRPQRVTIAPARGGGIRLGLSF
jgi:hypothetical protein